MNNCKYCKADCALRGEENLKECKGHIPMTNSDRIRAMSDEELADFLCKKFGCHSETCPGIELCKPNEGKANGLLKWLQQPVKEDKNETFVCAER